MLYFNAEMLLLNNLEETEDYDNKQIFFWSRSDMNFSNMKHKSQSQYRDW